VGLCLAVALLAQASHASEWQSVATTDDGIQIFRKETGDSGLLVRQKYGHNKHPTLSPHRIAGIPDRALEIDFPLIVSLRSRVVHRLRFDFLGD
jgi:hypothetical protein